MTLHATALNCSLKRSSGKPSSTDSMIALVAGEFAKQGVTLSETIRVADYNVLPGVSSDEGEGDQWPEIRGR